MYRNLLFLMIAAMFFVAFGAAQTGAILDTRDEYWIYMEGPEANEELGKDYPMVLEGPTEYEDSCWFNGTIYREGEIKDIGEKILDSEGNPITFETGGWYPDREICVNIPGRGDDVSSSENRKSDNYRGPDKGGEWWDQDQWIVTRYLRNNGGSVYSDTWEQELWVEQPDSASDPSETGIIPGEGIAMEDDCAPEQFCEDIRDGIGRDGPYSARFVEGALDDDNALDIDTSFSIQTLGLFDNRVQAGNETGHENGNTPGNSQDLEANITDLDQEPLQNSRIDPEDDEWALTPRLDWVVANDGTPYEYGRCYGADRVQGVDKNKRQAIYANSYANASQVYDGGKSNPGHFNRMLSASQDPQDYSRDGNWVNPDNEIRSITQGDYTCDLTGKDWGYGYRDTNCMNNDPPEASFMVADSWLTVTAESTSDDPDQNIVLREWDWTTDGNIDDTGETASNTYSSGGTYTITHNVTDECGAYDTVSRDVTVTPGVPEGGGSIASISFPNSDGERSIIPTKDSNGNYNNMCIGEGCTHETGQGPTGYDDNEFVNLSSDNMSGTLQTSTVEIPTGKTLCIGKGCTWAAGSAVGILGKDGQSMDGSLKTDALTTISDQCIGSEC